MKCVGSRWMERSGGAVMKMSDESSSGVEMGNGKENKSKDLRWIRKRE